MSLRCVELEYEDDALKVVERLEETAGRRFAVIYVPATGKYRIVPMIVEDGKVRGGEPLTEEELRKLSEVAYDYYEYIKRLRRSTRPPMRRYYVIQIGDVVFGGATPTKGRIVSKEEAYRRLRSILISEVYNYYYGGPATRGKWKTIRLLYYVHEGVEPQVVKGFKTPEVALLWLRMTKEMVRETVETEL